MTITYGVRRRLYEPPLQSSGNCRARFIAITCSVPTHTLTQKLALRASRMNSKLSNASFCGASFFASILYTYGANARVYDMVQNRKLLLLLLPSMRALRLELICYMQVRVYTRINSSFSRTVASRAREYMDYMEKKRRKTIDSGTRVQLIRILCYVTLELFFFLYALFYGFLVSESSLREWKRKTSSSHLWASLVTLFWSCKLAEKNAERVEAAENRVHATSLFNQVIFLKRRRAID